MDSGWNVRRYGAPRLGPDVVDRPRLIAALGAHRAPLTVVRGPAGSGKSTLVARWLETTGGTDAAGAGAGGGAVELWHTRDEPMGTRSSYWSDVIEALARHRLISRASAQHWAQSLLQPQFTRRAVRSALEEIGAPVTLVLENFGPPGRHWDG
ncbi:MAG: hypothetical protein J7480_00775, partial [Microbacteriaceae bacterium]|nr:hypothetical protein [Microbacteriaceae bacterium]